MLEAFSNLAGGSMESQYLALISLLNQAETIANDLASDDQIPSPLALEIGEVKQAAIVAFADTNENTTLKGMREQYTSS